MRQNIFDVFSWSLGPEPLSQVLGDHRKVLDCILAIRQARKTNPSHSATPLERSGSVTKETTSQAAAERAMDPSKVSASEAEILRRDCEIALSLQHAITILSCFSCSPELHDFTAKLQMHFTRRLQMQQTKLRSRLTPKWLLCFLYICKRNHALCIQRSWLVPPAKLAGASAGTCQHQPEMQIHGFK